MESAALTSREFLEEAIGRKVESFRIKAGSNVGDNYMSVLYAIDVTVRIQEENDNKTENLHILSKCYPSHPGQQEFLNDGNIFWNELSIYKILIPEYVDLATKCGFGDTVLFPPLVAGSAVNFKKEHEACESPIAGKVYGPFENYIMMTDMRTTHGFRMADRIAGLDIDQMRLTIDALARLHALSWGYKKIHGLSALSAEFDFVNFKMADEAKKMWIDGMASNVDLAATTIREALGQDSIIAENTEKIKEIALLLIDFAYLQSVSEAELYAAHRVKRTGNVPEEEPWRVLLHGDCWTNNLLFRFDEATLKALEMVFVDLQCMRENCPTIDLTYLIYVSTTTAFRKAHLSEVLELYHARFSAYCEMMDVAPLPNFTVYELARRFHSSKIFGYYMAVACLPIMMKEAKDVENVATLGGREMADVMKSFTQHKAKNEKYSARIVALAQELYEEGVL